jgi:ribosomal protein S18 acetylase RimI-like enzyme
MTSETRAAAKIVEARPEHIPFIAWTILTAARSHMPRSTFDMVIDGGEPEVLRFLEALTSTQTIHFGHHSGFIVAEVDGRPAAALSGYLPSERGETLMQGIGEALEACKIDGEAFGERMAKVDSIFRVFAHPEDDPWTVEWVATHPDFRRRGLVDRLLDEILAIGRGRGKNNAHISVFIGNDPAQRAYEKNGFVVYGEGRDGEFEATYGSPGAYHMRRSM